MVVDHETMVATDDKAQRDIVLDHLQQIGPITPLDAMKKYNIMRLSARIYELRNDGYEIEDINESGQFAEYKLIKD